MKRAEEVIAQQTQDPDMRLYNVRYELTEEASEDGCRGNVAKLGAFGRLLITIRGIEVIRVQPYRFFVSKATAFSWDEVEPHIVDVLAALSSSQRLLELGEVERAEEPPIEEAVPDAA